ncbi:hypothetical protein ACI2KS_23805 [Pseudomonas sp. NPDC087358]|uniref:hypothetical protein n=1 Tax=Pseudomonas sp. NPDC087358 TaxID=3364439 RepID=UPI00384C3234
MNALKHAVSAVGGISAAARMCHVSSRAINKWVAAGRLPRTEYTGETQHAENLARGCNGAFTAQSLRDASARAYQQSTDEANSTAIETQGSALDVPVDASSTRAVEHRNRPEPLTS